MKELVVTTVETNMEHMMFAKSLLNFSYIENSKGKDRLLAGTAKEIDLE